MTCWPASRSMEDCNNYHYANTYQCNGNKMILKSGLVRCHTNVQITKEGWKNYMEIGMCQVLGMDEGIFDMLTCTYHIWFEVRVPCAYQCIEFCTWSHVKSKSW
jgi:hypothetical protein